MTRRCALVALWVACGAMPAPADEPIEATRLLHEAFQNQYEVDVTARIELAVRSRSGEERRRHFEAATRIIDDRMHSIGRLTYPEHLRGMTILQIETEDGGHDAFVYLPSLRSVRRVSTAQRGDAFFGTDVTYEDLERRRIDEYRVVGLREERLQGEAAFVIAARPRRPRAYAELRFWIAASDRAILQVHFLKRGAEAPFRSITAPRADMVVVGGHTLSTHLLVTNHARGTSTEVRYRDLAVDPEIDARLFSVHSLERGERIIGSR